MTLRFIQIFLNEVVNKYKNKKWFEKREVKEKTQKNQVVDDDDVSKPFHSREQQHLLWSWSSTNSPHICKEKKTIVIPFIYDAFHTKFGTELILYTIFLQISTKSVFRCVVGQIEEKQWER